MIETLIFCRILRHILYKRIGINSCYNKRIQYYFSKKQNIYRLLFFGFGQKQNRYLYVAYMNTKIRRQFWAFRIAHEAHTLAFNLFSNFFLVLLFFFSH